MCAHYFTQRFKPRLKTLSSKWAPESSLLLFGNEVLKIIHYKLVQQVAYCPICLFVSSPKRFIVFLAENTLSVGTLNNH